MRSPSHALCAVLVLALVGLAAIPAVAPSAWAEEEPGRGWMGVHVAPIGEGEEGEPGEPGHEGAEGLRILRVLPEGPAAKAGLQAGDVLLRVGDREIPGFELLAEILSDTVVGQEMPCRVRRGGDTIDVKLVLGPRPAELAEEHPEVAAARRELEILRLAMKAFLEEEKADAADRIEHAIHARELRLEGKRGEEAQKVFRTEPKRADLGELLLHASKIWAEFGHEQKAALTKELGKRYLAHAQRGAQREAHADREARIRQLKAQLQEITEVLHRLAREIEELREGR